MKKFTIEANTVYTITDFTGENPKTYEVKGLKGLEKYVENILGAFVDKMYSRHTGDYTTDIVKGLAYIEEHAEDLKMILAMRDQVEALKNPNVDHDCDDYYCNHCGSSSEKEELPAFIKDEKSLRELITFLSVNKKDWF